MSTFIYDKIIIIQDEYYNVNEINNVIYAEGNVSVFVIKTNSGFFTN